MTPDDRAQDTRAATDVPLTPSDTARFIHSDKPLPPLAKGREARHQAIADRVVELYAAQPRDGESFVYVSVGDLVERALAELDPEPDSARPGPLEFVLGFIVGGVVAALLAIPVGFLIRYLIPVYQAAYSWVG